MKIAAVCCTYNRPDLLGRMIACFEAQDYPDRELVILDDADQYANQEGDRWRLVSHRIRYPTLGDKRNAAVRLVSPDVDALAIWDDDDLYLPWQLSAMAATLERAEWAQPRQVLVARRGRYDRVEAFSRSDPTDIGYHGGWGFRREAFERLGYAAISNGEDREIAGRARELLGPSADTISTERPDPGYIYTWHGRAGGHLSAMGPPGDEAGYRTIGRQQVERVEQLDVRLPADYLLPIEATTRPRGW